MASRSAIGSSAASSDVRAERTQGPGPGQGLGPALANAQLEQGGEATGIRLAVSLLQPASIRRQTRAV